MTQEQTKISDIVRVDAVVRRKLVNCQTSSFAEILTEDLIRSTKRPGFIIQMQW